MKLYTRLLLWFLAANLITVAVTLALGSWFADRRYSQQDALADGRAAVEAYEAGGSPALRLWLERQRRTREVLGRLHDARDRPLDRPGPEDAPPREGPPEGRAAGGRPPPPPFAPGAGFSRTVSLQGAQGASYRWTGMRMPRRGTGALRVEAGVRLLAGFAVVALLALLAARHLARPIQRLQQAAAALAGGDLGARAEPALLRRRDELGALAGTFNRMADTLGSTLQAQRQLLRDVSHELRTPLGRLRLATELARDSGETRHFDRIDEEAEKLEALIQQVLSLARAQGGSGGAREPLDLAGLLTELCGDAAIEAEARGLHIVASLAPGAVVSANARELASAVENVLRNALHYGAAGSAVELELLREGPQWLIRISDRGPGVPQDQLAAIFQPFVRVSSARDPVSGGAGLGLAIAAAALAAQGGGIGARNREGGGLVVDLRLPAAPPAS